MKSILMPCLALLTLPASADEQRVYTVDAYGNVKYSDPSYSVGKDGRIVEVDTYGNKQPHKTQYVIRNSRVYEADSYGRIQYHKPSYAVGKDGRVVQTDAYGNKGKTQYQVKDGKVYETDAYGRVKQQKFEIKDKSHVRSEPRRDRRASH